MADTPLTSLDRIRIENLRVQGIVGLRRPERDAPQDILVNVVLSLDLRKVATSDSVTAGLNYSDVVKRIIRHITSAQRFTIEALANDVAGICLNFYQVHQATVRISKPAANDLAEAVAVEITRTADALVTPALIGLGSNSSPESNLREAVKRLGAVGKVISCSTVYESAAIGAAAEGYLNAVARVDTCLPAAEIRRTLKIIETEMGRTIELETANQIPIDLDLCMLGDQIIRASDVSIPDEDILTREYLSKGCAQVLPGGAYPITKEPLEIIADRLAGTSALRTRPDVILGLSAPNKIV